MKKIFIDSGPLVALFDASDKYHQSSLEFLQHHQHPLVTTLASLTEVLFLLDFSRNAQADFLEWIYRGGVVIYPIDLAAIKRIKQLVLKYSDLPMDFADACLVYLAEKLKIDTILAIDRDFSVYRIRGRKKFRIIDLARDQLNSLKGWQGNDDVEDAVIHESAFLPVQSTSLELQKFL